jgi:hypothetical protein
LRERNEEVECDQELYARGERRSFHLSAPQQRTRDSHNRPSEKKRSGPTHSTGARLCHTATVTAIIPTANRSDGLYGLTSFDSMKNNIKLSGYYPREKEEEDISASHGHTKIGQKFQEAEEFRTFRHISPRRQTFPVGCFFFFFFLYSYALRIPDSSS